MMSMTADEALDAYEAARHRLPKVATTAAPIQHVSGLGDLTDAFDVFLLDAFGVLNVGETVIPGVPDQVARLRAAGKRVLVVSNAASIDKTELMANYAGLGYDFSADDIVTSRDTLSARMDGKRSRHWGVMASASASLADLELAHAELLAEDPRAYRDCDAVLLIGTGDWTDARQTLLEDALRHVTKPVLVANPDIVAPRESGFSVEPGHVAHRLADALGVAPTFYGKPFSNIFDLAFERLGHVHKSRVVMVGDSLHTDILGARAYGIASALVQGYGFFAGGDARAAIERTGITPDYVMDRP